MDKTKQNQQEKIDALRKSAHCVLELYQELGELKDPRRDHLPMSFFRALASLTLERAQNGIPIEDVRFTAKELAEKVIELGFVKNKSKPKQDAADWVRTNWGKLEDEIQSRKPLLQTLAQRSDINYYPWIDKEVSIGGQGNNTYYYLTPKSFDAKDKSEPTQYPCPEGGLRYIQESLNNIPHWARWINGFTLHSWRKYVYIVSALGILLSWLAFIYLIVLVGMYTDISTVRWLSYWIVALFIGGFALSSPLFRVIMSRIVMAPLWMTPIKETSVQLEYTKIGNDSDGKAIRELRLMVYSAKCPICDGRVEVENGGIQFPFRLVGRCLESPREHVFSFDHVTKVGKPLV